MNYYNAQDIQGLRRRCGCYAKSNQSSSQEYDPLILPLKNINYEVEIVNSIVSITLVQTYYNPFDKYLQVQYSFPLDPNSCIYNFTAQFANKKILGIVKRKHQAIKQYQQAINQGRQVAYGQIDKKSADVMNLSIGNINPFTQVVITIQIMQQLSIARSTFYKLLIPSTISPRYMNENEQDFPNQRGNTVTLNRKMSLTWNFKIILRTSQKVIFFNSLSHKLQMISQNQFKTQTILVMNKQCFPNKDFQFFYTVQNFSIPSYAIGCTDQSSTVLLSFIPKYCEIKLDDAYRAQIANQPFQTYSETSMSQYIFVLDRSGSMQGKRMKKAKEGLIFFLKSLPNNCYFNIVSFGSKYEHLFVDSAQYNDKNLKYAIQRVQAMNADMLGTEIQKPLASILNKPNKDGFIKQIFLLTDGAVFNTNKVIKLVGKNIKHSRVHTIGIGTGASIALIKGCADRGRGKAIFLSDDCDPSQQIIGMLAEVMSPVINKVKLQFNKQLVESVVPNPNNIPYILKNDVMNFYITFKGKITQKQQIYFSYFLNGVQYSFTIHIQPFGFLNIPFVDKMAHFKVIKTFEKCVKEEGQAQENMLCVKTFYYEHQAIEESIKHNILSQFTSFICIGKQLVDNKYQQFLSKQSKIISILPSYQQQYLQQQMRHFYDTYRDNKATTNFQICVPVEDEEVAPDVIQRKQEGIIKQMTNFFGNIFGSCYRNVPRQENKLTTRFINTQKSDGSWDSQQIFKEILNNIADSTKPKKLIGQFSKEVVMTYLISKWIKTYHPNPKYRLIIKKAQSWVQSQCKQNNLNFSRLQQLDLII